jgi:hypothetical protein
VSYYPFEHAIDRQKKSGFATLTVAEKWDWHADVYGFRRAFLDIEPAIETSPCDEHGTWFDPARAGAAEIHYRRKFGKAARTNGKRPPPSAEDIAYVERLLDSTIRLTAETFKRVPTSPYDR